MRTLAHLDCQAQTLGSFGFQSLAASGSIGGIVLSALLALFIALYAIRLLFGPGDEPRDVMNAVLKVGIVLTMAVSWPAWRTVAYDTVLYGPAEVATAIMPSTLPDPRNEFAQRLQAIDSGIAVLTEAGTGRDTGQLASDDPGSTFRSVALEDETGLGWARSVYLASTIGSLAALRIAGGLLLALAPLFAGLLLFDLTRGIFVGWLRGLVLVALGSLGLTVLLSVQLALTQPWLADVLNRRSLGYATPSAPTELLALVAAFALATAGMVYLLGKVAFQQAMATGRPTLAKIVTDRGLAENVSRASGGPAKLPVHSRALAVSESVQALIRRENRYETIDRARLIGGLAGPASAHGHSGRPAPPVEALGGGYRRTTQRDARSKRARDERS
ncbi:MAG TPA: type IV secretion system protein [Croceibacterium sp.]